MTTTDPGPAPDAGPSEAGGVVLPASSNTPAVDSCAVHVRQSAGGGADVTVWEDGRRVTSLYLHPRGAADVRAELRPRPHEHSAWTTSGEITARAEEASHLFGRLRDATDAVAWGVAERDTGRPQVMSRLLPLLEEAVALVEAVAAEAVPDMCRHCTRVVEPWSGGWRERDTKGLGCAENGGGPHEPPAG